MVTAKAPSPPLDVIHTDDLVRPSSPLDLGTTPRRAASYNLVMDSLRSILSRAWAKFRSWPAWPQVITAVVVVAALGGSFSSEPEKATSADGVSEQPRHTEPPVSDAADEPPEPADSDPDSRCKPVAEQLLRQIEFGLTTNGKGRLRNDAFAVRSRDYEKVWMVAAEIDAPGLEGVGDVGVWGTNEDPSRKTSSGLVLRANAIAAEFSDWGAAAEEGAAADLNATDDGVFEAEECVLDALQS